MLTIIDRLFILPILPPFVTFYILTCPDSRSISQVEVMSVIKPAHSSHFATQIPGIVEAAIARNITICIFVIQHFTKMCCSNHYLETKGGLASSPASLFNNMIKIQEPAFLSPSQQAEIKGEKISFRYWRTTRQ
jgi:hypothetical protein